jgi:hypothetical protein
MMNRFLLGVLAAFSAAIALFFLKFLRESGDRLYGFFSAAFAVLTLDWVARALLSPRHESQHYLFLIRLLAFLLIIAGIVVKNRSRPRS